MNIRANPEPMLMGGIGDIIGAATGIFTPRQGRIINVTEAQGISAGVVTALVAAIIGVAILKKKKVI